jgi:hypothetical protein
MLMIINLRRRGFFNGNKRIVSIGIFGFGFTQFFLLFLWALVLTPLVDVNFQLESVAFWNPDLLKFLLSGV